MNVGEFFNRITALLGSAEQHAAKVSALTGERDKALSDLSSISVERDRLTAEVQRLTGEVESSKVFAASAAKAAEDAKAEAATAKAEADKLRTSPSAQAAAILGQVGHTAISASAGTSAEVAKPEKPKLFGFERMRAASNATAANRSTN
jgi:septal ring factor EnvC (AmiA/AmiB activator)